MAGLLRNLVLLSIWMINNFVGLLNIYAFVGENVHLENFSCMIIYGIIEERRNN